MSWIKTYLSSSIGRKQIVAKTGILLCLFLLTHLAGNLLLFCGFTTEYCAFNEYAAKLTSNKPFLYFAEVILFSIFGTHIYLALTLNAENSQARGPVGYDVNANAGDLTVPSKTMRFSGLWTLVFLIQHLYNFKFADQGEKGLFGVVEDAFQNPMWSAYYVLSMFVLAMHVRHGVKSVFQTYGVNHVKYNDIINKISLGYAAIIFIGFSSIPVWFLLKGGAA
jgi:succinate dehydrogenase / fumarate reductase, cytochrome b subunit